MKTEFSLDNPDEMMATLKVSMTLGRWMSLKEHIDNGSHVSVEIKKAINTMIFRAERQFYFEQGGEENGD